jgi:tellurite resistance protein
MIWLFMSDLPFSGLVWLAGPALVLISFVRLRSGGVRMSARVAHEQLQLAVQLAMIQVLLADGRMGPDELRRAAEIHRELTSVAVPDGIIEAQADLARSDGDDIAPFLGAVSSELSAEDRQLVLRAAVMMAIGDRDFAAAEQPALAEITKVLGLTPEALREVVAALR